MLPLSGVQAAIHAALVPALAPCPVLDLAGPNQTYPYVTIGEFMAGESDTLNEQGVDVEATLHFWSRQPGMAEIQLLMAQAKDALDRKRLPLAVDSGAQMVSIVWELAQTLRDPDGVTRHGVLRFRVLTFQQSAAQARAGANQPTTNKGE